MVEWVDLREPPKVLLEFAASFDFDEKYAAAGALAHYAHRKSVRALLYLANDDSHLARINALMSLAKLLQHKHLARFKLIVGRVMADHLKCPDDRRTAAMNIQPYLGDQVVLDRLLAAIQREIEDSHVYQNPYVLEEMLKALNVLGEEDRDYVVRKLINMGIVNPGFHPVVVKRGLRALFSLNPLQGLRYARLHLEEVYSVKSYKRHRKSCQTSRCSIRETAASIVRAVAIKEENLTKPAYQAELAKAIAALAQMAEPPPVDVIDYDYRMRERAFAYDAFWLIIKHNPSALSVEILGKTTYGSLPKKIRDHLEKSQKSV